MSGLAQIQALYASLPDKLARGRQTFTRPLTLTEKILIAHCHDFARQEWDRGRAILKLDVDRVSLQDATGQMAILQFMMSGRKRVAVPTVETIQTRHTLTREQIAWFRAGSALNAGQPVDPVTGRTADLAAATLKPTDTKAKPGKDV
jgi:hypothetical protein